MSRLEIEVSDELYLETEQKEVFWPPAKENYTIQVSISVQKNRTTNVLKWVKFFTTVKNGINEWRTRDNEWIM